MAPKSRRPSGTSAMPCRHSSCAATGPRSTPSRRTVPTRIGRRPAIALMRVVFPAPFGPTTLTSSRSPTLRDTSQTATASPWATSRRSTSSIGLAQVGPDDLRLPHHLARPPLRDDLSVAQHHHAVGEVEDGPHDVLDEDDRGSGGADPPDEPQRVGHLRRGQSREYLVEQHQLRLGGESAREV